MSAMKQQWRRWQRRQLPSRLFWKFFDPSAKQCIVLNRQGKIRHRPRVLQQQVFVVAVFLRLQDVGLSLARCLSGVLFLKTKPKENFSEHKKVTFFAFSRSVHLRWLPTTRWKCAEKCTRLVKCQSDQHHECDSISQNKRRQKKNKKRKRRGEDATPQIETRRLGFGKDSHFYQFGFNAWHAFFAFPLRLSLFSLLLFVHLFIFIFFEGGGGEWEWGVFSSLVGVFDQVRWRLRIVGRDRLLQSPL